MLDCIYIAIYCSIIAYVYGDILTDPDKILGGWGDWITELHADAANNKEWLKERFFYMISCSLCLSGQLSLWSFLFSQTFDLVQLVFTISLSILLTKIIQRWS